MKLLRILILALPGAFVVCGVVFLVIHGEADARPTVQLSADSIRPRTLEDTTQKAIVRDYSAAWQAMSNAFASNSTAPLNENFTGFALDKLSQRVKDQRASGLTTRIIDHGHHVDAIFYSRDGSAVELRDTANMETQVLDGTTVLHSDNAQIQYLAVLTSAADRWQVRVLESMRGGQ